MRNAISAIIALGLPWLGGSAAIAGPLAASMAASPAPTATYPCDMYAAAGTPCIAAHSMIRRMSASYTGNLFELSRRSDSATMNVGSLPNGMVNTAGIDQFCANTVCQIAELYDQIGTPSVGNNLPQATQLNMPTLLWMTTPYGRLPYIGAFGHEYLRNRTSTVNVPTGSTTPTTEYMVVDLTNIGSACCGTYGNAEVTVADTGNGHMFSVGYTTGAEGTSGTGNGPWAGVDWENGAYLYGAQPPSYFSTILAKYTPTGPAWELAYGGMNTPYLLQLHNGALPGGYTAHFEGGLSLGEGGDGSPAPVNFVEGAILATYSADGVDTRIQSGIQALLRGALPQPSNPANCSATAQAANILPNPFTLSGWTTGNGAAVTTAQADPNGGSNAALITGTTGNNAGGVSTSVTATSGAIYTFTAAVKATTTATNFPTFYAGCCSSAKLTGAAVNANIGQSVALVANISPILWSSSHYSNGWWYVKYVFVATPNGTALALGLTPPVSNSVGQLINVSAGLTATYYCPILQPGWVQ